MAVSGAFYLVGARSLGRDLALVRKTASYCEAEARPRFASKPRLGGG